MESESSLFFSTLSSSESKISTDEDGSSSFTHTSSKESYDPSENVEHTTKPSRVYFSFRCCLLTTCLLNACFLFLFICFCASVFIITISMTNSDKMKWYEMTYHHKNSNNVDKRLVQLDKDTAKGGFSFTDSEGAGVVYPINNLRGGSEYEVKAICSCRVDCREDKDCQGEEICHHYRCFPKKMFHDSKAEKEDWVHLTPSEEDLQLPGLGRRRRATRISKERRNVEALAVPVRIAVAFFVMASSYMAAQGVAYHMAKDKCDDTCTRPSDDTGSVSPLQDIEIQEITEADGSSGTRRVNPYYCEGSCIASSDVWSHYDLPPSLGGGFVDEYCEEKRHSSMVSEESVESANAMYKKVLTGHCKEVETPKDWEAALRNCQDFDKCRLDEKVIEHMCTSGETKCTLSTETWQI